MATTDTNDTDASVAQAKRIIDAGGELVRFTTQGTREAENLKNISKKISLFLVKQVGVRLQLLSRLLKSSRDLL